MPTRLESSTATSSRRTSGSSRTGPSRSWTSGSPSPWSRSPPSRRPASRSARRRISLRSRFAARISIPRTDIFSLGVLAYELVTGGKPFTGDHISTVLYKIMNEQPAAPSVQVPGLPRGLDAFVLKSLEKDRTRRYASCAEMKADVVAVLAALSNSAPREAVAARGRGANGRDPYRGIPDRRRASLARPRHAAHPVDPAPPDAGRRRGRPPPHVRRLAGRPGRHGGPCGRAGYRRCGSSSRPPSSSSPAAPRSGSTRRRRRRGPGPRPKRPRHRPSGDAPRRPQPSRPAARPPHPARALDGVRARSPPREPLPRRPDAGPRARTHAEARRAP